MTNGNNPRPAVSGLPTPPFTKVLVANRSEIAIRVMRSLRELGVGSVAIYSDADRESLHVSYADEAVCIGGQLPGESYLRVDAVLEAARITGAQAIHPGYGFLAENADFARACAGAGIVFIGPSADAIDRMGSKTGSREIMKAAGVPIVPGSVEAVDTLEAAQAAADEVGYPVAVKARSGGGGKGFRVALTPADFATAFEGARREGDRYFSDPAVYIERYLPNPRHVEVQILGDHHGTVVHLGERDCTVQRRHQKLVEESPCPVATDELRAQLAEIALGAARAVDYTSAGTIECLLDEQGDAYFLEMNTRVQVEHTVTELVTGIDIVAEQIRIAAGQPLSFVQADVKLRGHALECRINAEDAHADFLPSSGRITKWHEPAGIGVRVDAGFGPNATVTPFYDTLVAKLVVHAATRNEARARMCRALDEFVIEGVETLVGFHRALVASDEFAAAGACRDMVEHPAKYLPGQAGGALSAGATVGTQTPGTAAGNARPGDRRLVPTTHIVETDGVRSTVVSFDEQVGLALPPLVRDRSARVGGDSGAVTAPIPGNVLQLTVAEGQVVSAGDIVVILEAMKMENEIAAAIDGVISSVAVSTGDAVAAGQLLVAIEGVE